MYCFKTFLSHLRCIVFRCSITPTVFPDLDGISTLCKIIIQAKERMYARVCEGGIARDRLKRTNTANTSHNILHASWFIKRILVIDNKS